MTSSTTRPAPHWHRLAWPGLEALALLWGLAAAALYPSMGRYDLPAIALSVAAFGLFLAAPTGQGLVRWLGTDRDLRLARLLLVLAAGLCALAVLEPRFIYVRKFRTSWGYAGLQAIAAVLLLAAAWASRRPTGFDLRLARAAALLLAASHLLVPVFSPVPHIDSWTLQQEAVDLLLAGRNPYAADYTQIYPPGLYGYVSHFGYLPLVALWNAPFRLLLGEVRFGYVLADAITAWFLIRLTLGRAPEPRRHLLATAVAAAFFANPMQAFVIEQCWTEPLLLLTASVAVLATLRGSRMAGIAQGLVLAAKQTNLLFAPVLLAARARGRNLAQAMAVVAGLILPFFLWDPEAFLQSTVFVFGAMPPRRDAFSLWTVAYNEAGLELSSLVTVAATASAGTLALAWAWVRRPDRALAGVVLAFWVLVLTARQSFANYHYFVHALLLLLFAVRTGAWVREEDS